MNQPLCQCDGAYGQCPREMTSEDLLCDSCRESKVCTTERTYNAQRRAKGKNERIWQALTGEA